MPDSELPLPAYVTGLIQLAESYAAAYVAALPSAAQSLQADALSRAEMLSAKALTALALRQGAELRQRYAARLIGQLTEPYPQRPRLIDTHLLSQTDEQEATQTAAITSLAASFAQSCEGIASALAVLNQHAIANGLVGWADDAPHCAPAYALWVSLFELGANTDQCLLALRALDNTGQQRWQENLAALAQRLGALRLAPHRPVIPLEPSPRGLKTLRERSSAQDSSLDAMLADHLLALPPGAAAQRLMRFNAWLDEVISEPQLPLSLGQELEAQRFALLKAALIDPSFFIPGPHPLRERISAACHRYSVVVTLGLSAASVRATLRGVVQAPPADAVLAALDDLAPLAESPPLNSPAQTRAHIEALQRDLRGHAQQRLGAASDQPGQVEPLLLQGLVPLLATSWLRDGVGSLAERQVLGWHTQLTQLLHQHSSADLTSLRSGLQSGWTALAFSKAQQDWLLEQLDAAIAPPHSGHGSAAERELNALLEALEEIDE